MEEVGDGVGELYFHDFADDGAEERFGEPGEPAEFALAGAVVEVVDVHADGFEGEDFLEAFAADFDVEVDVDASLVEFEGGDALVGEPEDAVVCAEPEADVVGAQGEPVELDGDEGGDGRGGAEAGFADFEVVVGFDAEAIREERCVIDGAAGLDDEIFE